MKMKPPIPVWVVFCLFAGFDGELDLCKQFGISRPSVRTALLSLVNDGYLVRTKGKGTFVTMPQRLEESTLFIESFAEESRKQGRTIKTEVLEFRIMRAEEKIRARMLNGNICHIILLL